jgi:dimethylamine/trimethylamine dehydrogenase
MKLLAQVENHAAVAIRPLIEKYNLISKSDDELKASGRLQAAGKTTDWKRLITEMKETFPAYIDQIRMLEAMAPPADLLALRILTAHEVAAVKFLDLEIGQDPASTAPMERYLETGTA